MNEQLAEWIEVDDTRYNEPVSSEGPGLKGVVIHMSMSPYDVPHQVRGDYRPNSKKFVIDFKYIDSEPMKELHVDQHIIAMVGERSGRVYSLIVDVDAMGVKSVEVKIVPEGLKATAARALNSISSALLNRKHSSKPNDSNYTVANKIVSDYWTDLTREFVGAR